MYNVFEHMCAIVNFATRKKSGVESDGCCGGGPCNWSDNQKAKIVN